MKNEVTQPTPVWETPDMIVLPVNEVTLGAGEAGFDFASEIST